MRKVSLFSFVVVLAVAAIAAQASTIITPAGAGTAYGSQWCPVNQAFDNQPTWDGTQPVGPDPVSGSNSAFYAGRWGFMDFGADFANIRIEQTWTRYRPWSAGDVSTWVGGFWTDTDPGAWPAQIPATITETRLQFESQTALAAVGGSEHKWVRDADMTASPVTPLGRYLVLNVKTPDPQGRGEEYAIVGYIVPEPVTMSLLALGGLALLRRK